MPRLSAGSILALDALPRRLNLARSLRAVTIVSLVGSTFVAPLPAGGAPSAPPATRQTSRPTMRNHPGWHAPRPRVHEVSDEPAPSESPLEPRQSLASPAPAASATGGTVYLATRVHVARSRDFYSASPHWEDVRGALPLPLEPATGITEFALDPFDPAQRAWASYSGAFGHGSLWRADDLDAPQPTWKEVLNEAEILQATGKAPTSLLGALAVPGQGGPAGKAYATVMRVVASRLQPGLLFVAVSAEGRLYVGRSADYGESWTWSASIGGAYAPVPLELSDHDPDRLWVGTIGPWRILVSEDGGVTFREVYTFPQFWFLSDIYSPPAGNPDDQILFTIARTTTYLADVLRSSDGGKSWSIVTLPSAPPSQLNRTLGSDPSNAQNVFYTAVDCGANWSFQASTDGGLTWERRHSTSAGLSSVWMWPSDPSRLLTARSGDGWSTSGPVAVFSSDSGYTWQDKTGDWFSSIGPYYYGSPGTCYGMASVTIVDVYAASVQDDATRSYCGGGFGDRRECRFTNQARTQGPVADPINTRSGGMDYPVEDLSVPTSAGPLVFQRSYSSLATTTDTTPLGFGWTHNHDTRLILPDDPGGSPGFVFFRAHSSNLYSFTDLGDGSYRPAPGLLASLRRDPGPPARFTLVDASQNAYTFSAENGGANGDPAQNGGANGETGRLLTWSDAQGHAWAYSYDEGGRLTRVSAEPFLPGNGIRRAAPGGAAADGGARSLSFGYDPQGRIVSVEDQGGRSVSFGYPANNGGASGDAAGDLTSATDVLGGVWTYTYDSAHRLTQVSDPRGVAVMRTDYDGLGRAVRQFNGADERVVEISYGPDGAATVVDARGNASLDDYDLRNTLTGETDALGGLSSKTYDANFRPASVTDPAGHTTQMTWSADGADLTQLTDAAGGQAEMAYDALHNLTQVTDARDNITSYTYSGALLTSSTDALQQATTYTYTDVAEPFLPRNGIRRAAPGGAAADDPAPARPARIGQGPPGAHHALQLRRPRPTRIDDGRLGQGMDLSLRRSGPPGRDDRPARPRDEERVRRRRQAHTPHAQPRPLSPAERRGRGQHRHRIRL